MPDGLLRSLLLVRATRLRLTLPPAVIADGLEILNPTRWESLYEPQVLLTPMHNIEGRRNAVRHKVHRWTHLAEESKLTQGVIVAVSAGIELPDEAAEVVDGLQGMFQEACPVAQLVQILQEKGHNCELAWVKPMQPNVRSELLTVLRGAKHQRHSELDQQNILEAAYEHLTHLERVEGKLKPSLDELRDYHVWRQELLRRRAKRNGHRDCDQDAV